MNETEEKSDESVENTKALVEGVDFYFEDGLMVLTRQYLLDRGYCCKNGCRNCPYGYTASVSLK